MNRQSANHSSATRHSGVLGVALAAWLLAAGVAGAQSVSYPRDPDTVVASYTLKIGELEEADPGPSVRVYGDGRAVVHIPAYMRNAGDYSVQLTDAEMTSLMSALAADELLGFDNDAVRKAKRDSLRFNRGGGADGQPVLFEVTDPSLTTIELRVRRGGGGAAASAASEVSKTISWSGLESDEREFPDVSAIQKLSVAKNRLRAVMERSDLQPVP